MPFNIQESKQSQIFEHEIKTKMYRGLYNASKQSRWTRVTGLAVGVAACLITIAARIAQIFEALIKGVIHLCGAPCNKDCSAKKGATILFKELPLALVSLIMSTFSGISNIVPAMIHTAIEPKEFYASKWLKHDLELGVLAAQAKTDPEAAFILGQKLYNGDGAPNDAKSALAIFEKYAEEKHLPSIAMLAFHHINDKDEASRWLKQGLQADTESFKNELTKEAYKPLLDMVNQFSSESEVSQGSDAAQPEAEASESSSEVAQPDKNSVSDEMMID